MYQVSQGFQTTMLAIKRQVFGRVIVDYSDPFLDSSIDVTVNEAANLSQTVQVADGKESPTYKWASLDGSWALDGSFRLAPDDEATAKYNQLGWWGLQLAGTGGNFVAPYPTLIVSFAKRTVILLKAFGDSQRGEYPVDFTIKLYNSSDTALYTETVTGNTKVKWSKETAGISDVVKMVLQITKWSHPGRQVKLIDFFTAIQEIYEGDDIFFLNLLEEREVSTGSLPIGNISANEIDLTLFNRERKFDAGNTVSKLYGLIRPNRRIRPYLGVEVNGTVEWVPLGIFWSNDWDVPRDDIYASTSGRDRLEILQKSVYATSRVVTNISLKALAEKIFQDAGLAAEEYWIDAELAGYQIPYGWFEQVSHREALRLIAETCCGQVYADRNGIVRLEGPSFLVKQRTAVVQTITEDDYFCKLNPANYAELANYIEVSTQPLTLATEAVEVYKANEAETIGANETKTLTVNYSKKPVIEAVASLTDAPTGAKITEASYYAWGAVITVISPATGTFNLTVTGKPLEVQGEQLIIAKDDVSIRENGLLRFTFPDNHLIQTSMLAKKIAETCLTLSKDPRRNLELEWRGNVALQLGDRINAPDSQNSNTDFWVISQTLEWDGGFKSNIKGKKVL